MAQSSRAPAPAHSQPQSSAPFLSLRHVSHALPDGRILLNDVSHDFDGSTRYGLIGRNGAGKSMLLQLAHGAVAVVGVHLAVLLAALAVECGVGKNGHVNHPL